MDFHGKVALVTGAASGIGKAVARAFLQRGAKVSICDVNIEEGKKVKEEFEKEFGKNRVIFSLCDVSKDDDFEAAYSECEKSLGRLEILVNNAGIHHKKLRNVTAVNFEGAVRGTELAIKNMGKHNGGKGGYVVNIGSITGLLPYAIMPYYAPTKAALIHFCRIMGSKLHFDYSGVSVLCLCPGGVNTPMNSSDAVESTAYNQFVANKIPDFKNVLAMLEPEELAEAVIRLLNENKSGEVVVADKDIGFKYIPSPLKNSDMGIED